MTAHSFSRLTFIAQQGQSELILTTRRKGHRQTLIFNGQLVCSRAGKNADLDLGPGADAFDPAHLTTAFEAMAGEIGYDVDHASRTVQRADLPGQERLPGFDDSAVQHGVFALTCERCAASVIFTAPDETELRICPQCFREESLARNAAIAGQLEGIRTRLDAAQQSQRPSASPPGQEAREALAELTSIATHLRKTSSGPNRSRS